MDRHACQISTSMLLDYISIPCVLHHLSFHLSLVFVDIGHPLITMLHSKASPSCYFSLSPELITGDTHHCDWARIVSWLCRNCTISPVLLIFVSSYCCTFQVLKLLSLSTSKLLIVHLFSVCCYVATLLCCQPTIFLHSCHRPC